MDYNLPPPKSLRHGALVAEAFALFTQSPVKNEILKLFTDNSWDKFSDKWGEIEKTVKERVEKLKLPQTLEREVLDISKPIGLEILEWAEYYGQYYSESAFLNNLCWTSEGAIDAEKTARKLVNDQSLSVLKRYTLACIHCFEDCIPDLWKQLNKKVSNEKYLDKIKRRDSYNSLVVFWSYYIHGRVNEIIRDIPGSSAYEYGLKRAIDQGSSVAAKYFWEKLTPIEKEKNLEQCVITAARQPLTGSGLDRDPIRFPKSSYTNIFCFLLNQMSEEQQMKILNNPDTAEDVLNGLLHFPYQQFFIPTAERAWNSLQKQERYYLLSSIADNISNYPQSYRELLSYTWQKILDEEPEIELWKIWQTLSELCKIEDHWSIELILGSVSTSAKEQFIFSYEGDDVCHNLIGQNKWNTLKFLIGSCLTNNVIALKFKKEEKISPYLLKEEHLDHAAKFNEFLNDFIASFGPCTKRKREDYEIVNKEMKLEVVVNTESRVKRKEREDDDFGSISKKIKTNLEVIKIYSNDIGLK